MEQLNVRIEKDPEGGWLAVLPPHPDMPGEEFGLPAETEEDAKAEARAYRAIEQSSMYKFDWDESEGNYVVKLGEDEFRAPLLAEAYGQAQAAYAERINAAPKAEPAPEPAPKPEEPKQAKKPRARPSNNKPAGNGETAPAPMATPQVAAPKPDPAPTPLPKLDTELKARLDKVEAILVVMARTILKEIKGE